MLLIIVKSRYGSYPKLVGTSIWWKRSNVDTAWGILMPWKHFDGHISRFVKHVHKSLWWSLPLSIVDGQHGQDVLYRKGGAESESKFRSEPELWEREASFGMYHTLSWFRDDRWSWPWHRCTIDRLPKMKYIPWVVPMNAQTAQCEREYQISGTLL